KGVGFVRPPLQPHQESVTSEGVAASNATTWQTAGRDGAGVKVAVIDLNFAGYGPEVAAGELPANVTAVSFGQGDPSDPRHGIAAAEIGHGMAPAAQIYLISVATEVELGQAEQYAVAHGIKIVDHSIGWFNSSRGDGSGGPGTPDAIVADARAHGILWVN